MSQVARVSPYLGELGPWLEHAARIFLFNEPVGALPSPPLLDDAADRLAAFLSSDAFPLHLHGIDLADAALSRALLVIAAAPLIWNVVGQAEYRTRAVSRMFGKYGGAYMLAAWIFCFSLYRDMLFLAAMEAQPTAPMLGGPEFVAAGVAMYAVGCVLVASSMLRLGITGTYLGDHFGILMPRKVTAFPYNYFDSPMYDGATLCFLGKAVMEESPAGVLMALWVYFVYQLAIAVEGYGLPTPVSCYRW